MKKTIYIVLLIAFTLSSCSDNFNEAVDFTDIENPNLSETSIVGQPNSSKIWLTGLERETSLAYNEIIILAELGSDNYINTETFFNQFLDNIDIRVEDPDIRDTQYRIARLRESALFGLETVGPADSEYATITEAEYNFYEGLSYMLAGMYFSALPQEELGVAVSSVENYNSAINSFNKAITINPDIPYYYMAMARVYYYLGNKSAAVDAAKKALTLDNSFIKAAKYDQDDGPSNTMESALFARSTFDDLQPLPTLDFLDPKYSFLSSGEDPAVNFLKAEEAYLILAEANLSTDIGMAKQNLKNLLMLIATREVRTFSDTIEDRTQDEPGSRPDTTSVVVNGREGLVLYRKGEQISVPSVSGTSLTDEEINMASTEDELLKLIYRTRQEVFIAEGIRCVDMGVKLVIHENEILQNPNINAGDPSTVPVIPSFISSVVSDLDAITYDRTSGMAMTAIDLNDILVQNKTSSEVIPFY